MPKLMVFIKKTAAMDMPHFRSALEHYLHSVQQQFTAIRYALADADVAPAQALAITSSHHPKDAVVSLYYDGAVDVQGILADLAPLAESSLCYQVDERVPLPYLPMHGRVDGMCQIALLKKPQHLTREQWLDIWLNSHTQVAIATQSTFSYRQNIVTSAQPADAGPVYDAIVEEQFPPAAMTSRAVFFNSKGDDAQYLANEKAMIDSVMRFVDFNVFECLPMSEYRLK